VRILVKIIINALALWASTLLPNVGFGQGSVGHKILSLLIVAVIFGIINAVLKPIIKVVGCGFYILTLGLISLVVNALLFLLTGYLAGKLHLAFHVHGFWAGFFGAIIVAVVGFVLHLIIPERKGDD
jgi:putative membrane protein